MRKKIILIIITSLVLSIGTQVEAQTFKELLKAKIALAKKQLEKKNNSKKQNNTVEKTKETKETKVLNDWHNANKVKIVFYNKYLKTKNSNSDSQNGVITKGTIGGSQPFYARAYFGEDFKKKCTDCENVTIRYSMGGVTITAQQIREEQSKLYYRFADALYYYDSQNYALSIPLTADKGQYHENYTLQEDTYRILLSKVKNQLKKGVTLTLKIEVIGLKDDQEVDTVMASGEIQLTVTDNSYNLQGLNCRCGRAGLTNQKVIKDVKEAFAFQFDDIKKVNKVVMLARDFSLVYDNSYPTKLVLGKAMWANIIYERNDGVFMMVKRYVFYKKSGSGFSDKITIGKHAFFLPVSPTCAK